MGSLLACGGGEDGSGGGSGSTSGGASTGGPTSAPTTGDATSGATGTGGGSTSEATGGGSTTGGGPGPTLLYIGPPGGAIIPDWDPAAPRPLLVDQRGFGPAWAGAYVEIHPDGTVESAAEQIAIWGFDGLPQIYDGAHFGGVYPGWQPDGPAPVLALGTGPTYGGDWVTMTPGLWVDTNGGFVAPGSLVERVLVWSFDGASEPPASIYEGPMDGTFVVPEWDPAAPRPLIVWGDTVVQGQWREIPYAIFDDGGTDFDMISVRVFGW